MARLPVHKLRTNTKELNLGSAKEGVGVTEWRPVLGYEGLYEVSSQGGMRSLDRVVSQFHWKSGKNVEYRYRGKLLTPEQQKSGYLYQILTRGGKSRKQLVSVMVCEAFHGCRPAKCEAAHKNGVRTDNEAENLYWATKQQQLADKKRHGTHQAGEKNGRARLTLEQVQYVRTSTKTQKALGVELGVARSTIQAIRSGSSWAGIQ